MTCVATGVVLWLLFSTEEIVTAPRGLLPLPEIITASSSPQVCRVCLFFVPFLSLYLVRAIFSPHFHNIPQPPTHHMGQISLIMGPMFSGKTRELKRRIDVKRIASVRKDLRCLLIKYRKDTRYDEKAMVTHNHIKDHDCIVADSLAEVKNAVKDCQFIFIDEGQFFKGLICFMILSLSLSLSLPHPRPPPTPRQNHSQTPAIHSDLLTHCLRWAREGREVTVAALDAYASQDLWPEIARLIPWCISLLKLNAVCGQCGSDASLTITRQGPSSKSEKKIGKKASPLIHPYTIATTTITRLA